MELGRFLPCIGGIFVFSRSQRHVAILHPCRRLLGIACGQNVAQSFQEGQRQIRLLKFSRQIGPRLNGKTVVGLGLQDLIAALCGRFQIAVFSEKQGLHEENCGVG